jgi:hypothetical protein
MVTKYYLGAQMKNEMGGACRKYGGKKRFIWNFDGAI